MFASEEELLPSLELSDYTPEEQKFDVNNFTLDEPIQKSPRKRRKKPKSNTPIQKLTSDMRSAIKRCSVPLFPANFIVRKKITVYLRDALQNFAKDLCDKGELNGIKPLTLLFNEVMCPQGAIWGEDALNFLLVFFKSKKQVAEALEILPIYRVGFNGEMEFTTVGKNIIQNIIYYYQNKIRL